MKHYNPQGRKAVERCFLLSCKPFMWLKYGENRFYPAERSVNRPERMASQVERWTDFPGTATWSVTKNILFLIIKHTEEWTEVQLH